MEPRCALLKATTRYLITVQGHDMLPCIVVVLPLLKIMLIEQHRASTFWAKLDLSLANQNLSPSSCFIPGDARYYYIVL